MDIDLLNTLVAEAKKALRELEETMNAAQTELETWTTSAETVRQEYAQLIGWAELYGNCTFEAKKMIAAQFIKAIYVSRNYELDIQFNVSFADFQRLYIEGEHSKRVEAQALQPSCLKYGGR